MKTQKILLCLTLSLVLTACQNSPTSQKAVSDETINNALDSSEKSSQEELKTENKDKKTTTEKSKNEIDYDHRRKMIVDIGDFSKTVADNITDNQLDEIIKDAKKSTVETGYRDTKDFVFQELAKRYPELSNKFPLDSVERKYERIRSEDGDITDKLDYQRRALADAGFPSDEVRALSDREIEDAFMKAYEKDDELFFDDYVILAGNILFGENKKDLSEARNSEKQDDLSLDQTDTKSKKSKENMHYGSSQTDYDALKSSLVQFYEFTPAAVNQITNEYIDIAYNRAMDKISESGNGDFSLIIEELGYMYPGASKMYPGDESMEEENN